MPIVETDLDYEKLYKTLNLLGYRVKGEIEPINEKAGNIECSIYLSAEKNGDSKITANYHLERPNGKVLQAILSATSEQLSEIEKLLQN